ncbi:MAG: DUF58 domain-containing protein [bacterium]|nr:DUF58 domain-containing protein [bacterium]
MRRNRMIWGILWILSLVGISFFGGTISYGFFAAMTFLPLISLLYLLYVYFFFHIYQELDNRTLVVNETIPFTFMLVNEYPFAFVGVRVRFYYSFSTINGLSDDTEYELLPRSEIKKVTRLTCKYRGEYEVGIKTVEIQDYFRLFRISYHNRSAIRALVRPQLVHLSELKQIDMSHVMREAKLHPTNLDVLTRGYVPGDDIRQIHWALTARSGELMTRERIGEEQQGIGIILETARYSEKPTDYLPVENKMLECVLALALFFAGKGILLHTYHREEKLRINSVEKMAQFDDFYSMISDIQFDEQESQEKLFTELSARRDIFMCHAVFLVLHTWSEAAHRMALKLSENQVFVVVYLITEQLPDDIQFEEAAKIKVIQIPPNANLKEVL